MFLLCICIFLVTLTCFLIYVECFQQLLQELIELPSASDLFPEPDVDTINSRALSRELRVLSVLWYLGTPDSYRSIAERLA